MLAGIDTRVYGTCLSPRQKGACWACRCRPHGVFTTAPPLQCPLHRQVTCIRRLVCIETRAYAHAGCWHTATSPDADDLRPLQPGKILPSNQVEVLHNIVVGFYLPRVEAALGDLKVGRVLDGAAIVGISRAYASVSEFVWICACLHVLGNFPLAMGGEDGDPRCSPQAWG